MKEKLDDSYELMLAIEGFLINKLNATIDGHSSDDSDKEVEFDIQVDGKKYNIEIKETEEDEDV